ncbi:MAG: PLDc N-terminal domain-containing protein [Desulfamplus sp.]|nr:PLDc N-terminal domain-containing protein [Desulfamplus sp.]MBF0411365.1 PLDc N-terminal domain-containing protein [Desulfamplus sp.]
MDTFIVVAGMALVFWGFTMLAIVNIILKDFGSMQNKAIWGLVALIPFVGWIIYFIFGAKRGVRKELKKSSKIAPKS